MSKLRLKNSCVVIVLFGLVFGFWNCQKKEANIQEQTAITQSDTLTDDTLIYVDSLTTRSAYKKAINVLDTAKADALKQKNWEKYVIYGVKQCRIFDNISDSLKRQCAIHTLQVAQNQLDTQNENLGLALQQMAEVHTLYEQYDSSIIYYNKSIEILKKNKKWEDYAWAVISKSVNYYYLKEYDLFEQDLLLAQDIYEKQDLEEEIFITTIDLLAVAYDAEGDFDKAIENTKNSVQFYLKQPQLSSADSNMITNNYLNIAAFYSGKGGYQQAYNYDSKVIDFSKNNNPSHYLRALVSICSDALRVEDYTKSIKYGHRCLQIIKKIPRNEQAKEYEQVYNYIGLSFMNLNQFDSSAIYLKKEIPFSKHQHLSLIKMSYATLLLEQNKVDEALNVFNKINIKNLKEPYLKAVFNRNLGRAYAIQGDFDKAMPYFQKALHHRISTFTDTLNIYANPTVFDKIASPIFLLHDLKYKAYHLSQFSEKQQNLEAALATYDLAFQWMDTLTQSYSYDDSRIIHNKRNRDIYEQAIEVAHQLYERTNDKKYIDKAFNYTEKVKSNILLSELQYNENQTIIPKNIQDREKELVANVSFYERQLQTAKDNKEKDKVKLYHNYLTDYSIALGELKDSIKHNYPKYYELKYATTLAKIPTIQADLTDKQGFISYYSGDSATYVFTITNNAVSFSKLAKTSVIDEQVFAFRQILKQPENKVTSDIFKDYNQVSNQLFQTILANSIKSFSKNIRQLIIIPDGTLNYIPFEILTNKIVENSSQDFSKMPYLLYNYQIQYGYSATLLNKNKKRQNELKTNSKCLAFAPPYENNQPMAQRGTMQTLRDGTMQLQGTSKEIQAISTHFNGDFDQSETATKANFFKNAPNFGILHLAMHGEANYENEKFANLKFTNTKNQSKEDYLLYQSEIANMDLNAQLVVLSACETGLGKYVYGEGIASLGRSFMYAGVPSVVMSLWKVDDKATSQLMPYFYENLAAGMSKDKALHEAKLTFLKKEDFSKLYPHYWAGFVAIGDVQPIKKQTNWQYWLFGGLLMLVFGAGILIWKKRKR
jgi:CHAT domain-containing protein